MGESLIGCDPNSAATIVRDWGGSTKVNPGMKADTSNDTMKRVGILR